MPDDRIPDDLRRHLNRDAMTGGEPAAPDHLDLELAAVNQWLHALEDAPPADPVYANALREHVMHTATIPLLPPHDLAPPRNGRSQHPPGPPLGRTLPPSAVGVPQPTPRAHPSRLLSQALLALLLVAALVGGSLTVLHQRDQRAAAPLLLATPTGTATSDWPMYRGDPARAGYTSAPGPDGQPVILWQYTAGGTAWRSPAVAGGVAYLQSGDGMVTALDTATGAVRWQSPLGSVADTPAVAGDAVYVNTGGGNLVALDAATGAERWRFADHVAASTTPLVLDGVVYTGSDDGDVLALDAATGEQRWSANVGGAISRSLALVDDRLVVPTATGTIVALDDATGTEQWRVAGENVNDFVGTPAVANGVIYFGLSGRLHAVNAATGEELWSIAYSGTPSSAANGIVVSSDPAGVVHAFDAATGAERWTSTTTAKVQAAALLTADTAYIASLDHILYALDLATGSKRWS